jgi:hypothetical protein
MQPSFSQNINASRKDGLETDSSISQKRDPATRKALAR